LYCRADARPREQILVIFLGGRGPPYLHEALRLPPRSILGADWANCHCHFSPGR
jgi:hypothetical protein